MASWEALPEEQKQARIMQLQLAAVQRAHLVSLAVTTLARGLERQLVLPAVSQVVGGCWQLVLRWVAHAGGSGAKFPWVYAQ